MLHPVIVAAELVVSIAVGMDSSIDSEFQVSPETTDKEGVMSLLIDINTAHYGWNFPDLG